MIRVRSILSLSLALALAAPLPAQDAPKRTVTFTGTVLINGFWNTAGVNNVDLPLTASADTVGIKGGGAGIRQTRFGVLLNEPDVLGGTFTGEVDADFYGGQVASPGGRTFPLLRLRRATGTLAWEHVEVMIGQDVPLVAERNPRSLAAVGFPEFSQAGNLWLWIPQVRVSAEMGYSVRLALQAAVLAPTAGTAQSPYFTQLDSAERTGRPYLEGRLRLGWGPSDDPSEFAIGVHQGWLRNLDSLTNDSIQVSQAVTVDTRVVFGAVELIGEAFAGKALAGLGGGGIGQNFGVGGAPVRTKGGWAQLNVRPVHDWMVGGGCGLDDPNDADVPPTGKFKNLVCEGHVEWRPAGPLLFGFTFRRLQTTYANGTFTANHLNLAAGFHF
ncbi:MAG TPA: hypothetical protein VI160_01140 [Gemmatimonadales bacterium]